jgi:hypothetical protein
MVLILQIGKKIICTVKHADDFVLLAKEETVLQGMIAGLMQVRRICAVKMNGKTTKIMRISGKLTGKQNAIDKSNRECGIF